MNLIVAVDENWGIGKNNGLLFSLKEDMKYFREKTTGNVVCMGYNTLLSFPDSKPLKNRVNIVLCPEGIERDDLKCVHTLEELSEALNQYPTEKVFIIGGAMFYKTMLCHCEYLYITKVRANGEATVFFENLDKRSDFVLVSESDVVKDGEYEITFCTYKNLNVKKF